MILKKKKKILNYKRFNNLLDWTILNKADKSLNLEKKDLFFLYYNNILKRKNLGLELYKKLFLYTLKKGKKQTLEKIAKTGFIFWSKANKNKKNLNFFSNLEKAFLYTRPSLIVRTKRKGSKNIYLPLIISLRKGRFLSAKWILAEAFLKSKRYFYKEIITELFESAAKKSVTVKKRDDLQVFAFQSWVNSRK